MSFSKGSPGTAGLLVYFKRKRTAKEPAEARYCEDCTDSRVESRCQTNGRYESSEELPSVK